MLSFFCKALYTFLMAVMRGTCSKKATQRLSKEDETRKLIFSIFLIQVAGFMKEVYSTMQLVTPSCKFKCQT